MNGAVGAKPVRAFEETSIESKMIQMDRLKIGDDKILKTQRWAKRS